MISRKSRCSCQRAVLLASCILPSAGSFFTFIPHSGLQTFTTAATRQYAAAGAFSNDRRHRHLMLRRCQDRCNGVKEPVPLSMVQQQGWGEGDELGGINGELSSYRVSRQPFSSYEVDNPAPLRLPCFQLRLSPCTRAVNSREISSYRLFSGKSSSWSTNRRRTSWRDRLFVEECGVSATTGRGCYTPSHSECS